MIAIFRSHVPVAGCVLQYRHGQSRDWNLTHRRWPMGDDLGTANLDVSPGNLSVSIIALNIKPFSYMYTHTYTDAYAHEPWSKLLIRGLYRDYIGSFLKSY